MTQNKHLLVSSCNFFFLSLLKYMGQLQVATLKAEKMAADAIQSLKQNLRRYVFFLPHR